MERCRRTNHRWGGGRQGNPALDQQNVSFCSVLEDWWSVQMIWQYSRCPNSEGENCRSPLLPSVCQLAFGGVSSGQLTPTEIMLIAVIFSFLLEHNQQIIYFCSFITKPLLTDFLPFRDQKFGGVFAGGVRVRWGRFVFPPPVCRSLQVSELMGGCWWALIFSKSSRNDASLRNEPSLWPGCTPHAPLSNVAELTFNTECAYAHQVRVPFC